MNDEVLTDQPDAVQADDASRELVDADTLRRVVEAALFAAGHPLSVAQLQALFDNQPLPPQGVERALAALAEDSATRGVELVEVASGFRFQVRAEVQPWVSRLWAERQGRYSRALLETLALIAYRQPITRGEIEQIRGVAVNTQTIRTLEEREWVRVVGHRDVPGRPALYGTTRAFLDYFNLRSLDQLPPLGELIELPELDPQLDLDPPSPAAELASEPDTATDESARTAHIDQAAVDPTAPADALPQDDSHPAADAAPELSA